MPPPARQRVLGTDRLELRPWRLEEAPRLLDILGRYDVARWLGDDAAVEVLTDLDQARTRIRRFWERSLVAPLGTWAVVPRASGAPAGSVVLGELPNGAGDVEIGWHLHPESHGNGYATEAARLVLALAFAEGLREVHAVTHLDNRPSQAVCERLGMDDLGVLRRWYDDPSRVFRLTRQQHQDQGPDR